MAAIILKDLLGMKGRKERRKEGRREGKEGRE